MDILKKKNDKRMLKLLVAGKMDVTGKRGITLSAEFDVQVTVHCDKFL